MNYDIRCFNDFDKFSEVSTLAPIPILCRARNIAGCGVSTCLVFFPFPSAFRRRSSIAWLSDLSSASSCAFSVLYTPFTLFIGLCLFQSIVFLQLVVYFFQKILFVRPLCWDARILPSLCFNTKSLLSCFLPTFFFVMLFHFLYELVLLFQRGPFRF